MKNDEQAILYHIRPHIVSVLDVKNYVTFLPLDIEICLNIWYIMSNDRASASEIIDYI